MRRAVLAGFVVLGASLAHAQPPPPPNIPVPDPAQLPPAKPGEDMVLAEQIAASLVARAQELFDAKVYIDAKQLAVEALVRSPRGQAAAQAQFLIKAINTALGITDAPAKPPEKVD